MIVVFNRVPEVMILNHHKINLTFITDIHLSATPPGRRRDNYEQTILDKIRFASALTHKVKGAAICGGDVFHVKRWQSLANPPSMINQAIEVFSSFPGGNIYGIVGNHDFNHNISTLDNSPLGVLIASHVYRPITEPTVFRCQDEGVRVMVIGFDYRDTETTLEALKASKPEIDKYDDCYRVAVIHQVGRPGEDGDFFGERTIGYNTLEPYGFDVVLWGHDHSRVEPKKVGKTHHLHYGSLSRASLSIDEVDRDIVVPVISFSAEGIKVVEKIVPTVPLEACFQIADSSMKKVAKSEEMKMFLDDMEEQVSEVESDDPLEILDAICDDKTVKDLVKDYCEL